MKTSIKYFQKEYVTFLSSLKQNNNKEWFQTNKETYSKYVDVPFEDFVNQILKVIKKQDPTINIGPNEAIFRINRDIRFSKDKTPYKAFKSALISSKGRKSKQEPGFYLEMGSDNIRMAAGCFKLTPSQIKLVEENIHKVYDVSNNSIFKAYFGELIKTKNSLIFETNLSSELIDSDDLDILVLTHWQVIKPAISVFNEILFNNIKL